MWLFLSIRHLETIVGLLTGLIAKYLYLREYESSSGRREMGEWIISGTDRTHTFIKFTILYECRFLCPEPFTTVIAHHKNIIIMKKWTYYEK